MREQQVAYVPLDAVPIRPRPVPVTPAGSGSRMSHCAPASIGRSVDRGERNVQVELKGRIARVTGASKGIGLSIRAMAADRFLASDAVSYASDAIIPMHGCAACVP